MIYKIILFLIIFTINISFAEPCIKDDHDRYMQQWSRHTGENGKYAEVNRFCQEYIRPWLVRYDMRRKENGNVILTRIEMNLKDKKARVIEDSIYKTESDIYEFDKRIDYQNYSGTSEFKDIKNGTITHRILQSYEQMYAPWHRWEN